MFREFVAANREYLLRPIQAAHLVFGYKIFGLNPTPYHLSNAILIGLIVVLLYLLIRELRSERWLAFAIALQFGLLPHYSTDRFWVTMHGAANLSMAFGLLSMLALFRSKRRHEEHRRTWLALAVCALIASFLSYEVVLGFIAGMIILAAAHECHLARSQSQPISANLKSVLAITLSLFLVFVIKIRLQTRVVYHHHFFSRLGERSWNAIEQSFRFNFWTYGFKMPAVLLGLYRHSALSMVAVLVAVSIASLVSAYLWKHADPSVVPGASVSLWLIPTGLVLFALGYALHFPSETDFSSAGLANRVAIASALGASCILVGLLTLISNVFSTTLVRVRVFSIAMGVMCGLNSLVVSGIASFWVDGAAKQAEILQTLASNLRELPHGSVLLLDGICRFSGPGIVFEGDGDATGALQLRMHDFTLNADVISPNMTFGDDGVSTTMYGQPESHWPYSDHLVVYNLRNDSFTPLPSKQTAEEYLRNFNPGQDSGCPAGKDGDGTKVF